jgi:hypothetical protein
LLDFSSTLNSDVTEYNSEPWLTAALPEKKSSWRVYQSNAPLPLQNRDVQKIIRQATGFSPWEWPSKKIHFISDLHADAEALSSSLRIAGIIQKTGKLNSDFIIRPDSQKDQIIIGGDCLDKGPSNLQLLRTLHKLLQLKSDTLILAGNHDIRLYMGLKSIFETAQPSDQHFFVRMGVKVLPLFKEVYEQYIAKNTGQFDKKPSKQWCKKKLFPDANWEKLFIKSYGGQLNAKALTRELKSINKKQHKFEAQCRDMGLTLTKVYLAAKKCYELFLKPDGEFYWFFDSMKLIHREKSFLFTHAGIDDHNCQLLNQKGVKSINQLYKQQIKSDLGQFYYGRIANLLRTKYRNTDPELTPDGVKHLHQSGIHALVHGHVSQTSGQNIELRSGLFHFQCDVTLDRHSRARAGLTPFGAGLTTIHPKGKVSAFSTDSPVIKVFSPDRMN